MADSLSKSDVYQRYTATFTWQSDQSSHAGMGFFFTALIVLSVWALGGSAWWGFVFVIVPAVKDIGDYLGDVCPSGRLFAAQAREPALDGVADDLFWAVGTVVAVGLGLLFEPGVSATARLVYWIVAVVLFGGTLGAAYWYFVAEKKAFDKSALPYYFRLPNFEGELTDLNVGQVETFLGRGADAARFLLIGGGPGTGKTTLGAAIAGGLTSRRWGCRRVRYFTAAKLLDFIAGGGSDDAGSDPQEPWRFDEAEILVVDDLPVVADAAFEQNPVCQAIATAAESGMFDGKAAIWILGGTGTTGGWRGWLKQLPGLGGRIHAIDLGAAVRPNRKPAATPTPPLHSLCFLRPVLAIAFFVLLAVVPLFAVGVFAFR
jgi:hypothetical protein